jgi:hypothetical protein
MTKILEAVQMGEKDLSKGKTSRELTQQELADIYFAATGKAEKPEAPVVINVVQQKPRMASLIPWIIASFAFLIAALSLFSTKRIFIDVHVVDDKVRYADTSALPILDGTHESAAPGTGLAMQDFFFEGAAKLKSSKDKNSLTLVNSSVAPFARANIYFDPALDLTGSKIVFDAKGARGGESIAVAMRDRNNVQAFGRSKMMPFPGGLTTQWKKAEISLSSAEAGFDESSVVSLRLDFGSKDTDNKPGDMIFVKDLQIVRG